MRDFFLLATLPLFLLFIIKRPFIGVGLWIWTSLFYPNGWVYGAAASIRYNLLFAAITIATFLVKTKNFKFKLEIIGILVLIFWAWTTISSFLTVGSPEITWEIWGRFSKIIILFVFITIVITKKLEIDFFLWCVILSVGFYGSLEGLKYIASGGGHNIAGFFGHALGDRNELALAFVMVIPIIYYIFGEYGQKSIILKIVLPCMLVLNIIAIVGTSSRGGLIALLSLATYFVLKSDRKFVVAVFAIAVVSLLANLIPPEWFARMDTISAAKEDDSFMGRVVAWKQSFILAMQNPLFGGGFKSLEYFPVWSSLAQSFDSYPFFYTGDAVPDVHVARAAHSIYFQVLGDQGFVGFLLFLAIIVVSFIHAGWMEKKNYKAGGEVWISKLLTMLRLSIFAYCVGGAALSFAYFDLIFAYFALVIVIKKHVSSGKRESAALPKID